MSRFLAAFFLAISAILVAAPVSAFCRKTTANSNESYDPSISGECAAAAAKVLPLYRAYGCVELRVVVDPALVAQGKMTVERATAIVQRATTDWTAAQCTDSSGVTGPLAITFVDSANGACPDPQAVNEIAFTAVAAQGDGLLASTDVTFDAVTGILSASTTSLVDFYARIGAATASDADLVVEHVVRHELGHALGLAHSESVGAVMYTAYDPTRTDGLTDDDVRGICDLYASERPVGAGCSVGRRARSSEGAALFILTIAIAMAIFRRRAARAAAFAIVAFTVSNAAPLEAAESVPPKKTSTRSTSKAHKQRPASPAEVAFAAECEGLIHQDELTLSRPPLVPLSARLEVPPEGPNVGAAGAPARPEQAEAPRSAPRTTDLYAGARYRAFALPTFLVKPLANTNKDLLFHSVSAEAEFRKRDFSIIPALTFADLATGDMLVGSRANDLASSFSYVRSDMKVLAFSVGLTWSRPVSRTVALEVGLEVGLGATFGPLVDSWVYETSNGSLAYGGRRFEPCKTVSDGFGCRPQDHGSPTPVRVGDYHEPSFIDGGKAPTILPWVSLPIVGVRARLADDVTARFGIGASFTGIWAGVAIDYRVARAQP